jgi:hypothetical protein
MENEELTARLCATEFAVAALLVELADRSPERARFAADHLATCGAAPLPPAVAATIESLAKEWRAFAAARGG